MGRGPAGLTDRMERLVPVAGVVVSLKNHDFSRETVPKVADDESKGYGETVPKISSATFPQT